MRLSSVISFSILCLLLGSCSMHKEEEITTPDGMHAVSLKPYGKPFRLFVPDTMSSEFAVEENSDGGLVVTSGKHFAIAIYEQAADLALRRQDISSDEVNRVKRMITENDSVLMWESAITDPEYHFVTNRTIGGQTYSFNDVPGYNFGEADIRTMYESAAAAHAE